MASYSEELQRDNTKLREQLSSAAVTIREQKAVIDMVNAMPTPLMDVTEILKDTVILGGSLELPKPDGLKLQPGDLCRMHPQAGSIIGLSSYQALGQVATVKTVGADIAVVDTPGAQLAVRFGPKLGVLKPGLQVILNRSNSVILKVVERKETEFNISDINEVTWEMVGGLKDAKKALIEAVELPFRHKDLYAHFHKSPPKGILLHGLPGNGKTHLAKALATALRGLHGQKAAASGFISIRGPEVLSKWVGEAESTIRGIFEQAEDHYNEHQYPAIIFIDEADALLGTRGKHTASGMEHTIVPQFLTLMDGLKESHVLVVLATNRADTIDQAILRDGRVDRKIYVSRPSVEDALEVLHIHTKKLAFREKQKDILSLVVSWIYDSKIHFYEAQSKQGSVYLTLADLTSGASLAGMIDRATSNAINRCIEGTSKDHGYLIKQDFLQAVNAVITENARIQHTEVLQDFAERNQVHINQVHACVPQFVQDNAIAKA